VACLTVAAGVMTASLLLMLMGRRNAANSIAHWAPTILTVGLYNKMVKQAGGPAR
jgi:hypothetical protein